MRATRPNEYWHIDASILRLVDGTRVYLHAVMDNYSRRILGWRVEQRLNPQWLYLHRLDSITTIRRLVSFYVQQHNEVMPHSAFNGFTPDEVYLGKTDGVVKSLAAARVVASAERIESNQAASCPACPRAPPVVDTEGAAA